MQPSYALSPTTSYPKTVGGMCYVKIRAHTKRVKITISNWKTTGEES